MSLFLNSWHGQREGHALSSLMMESSVGGGREVWSEGVGGDRGLAWLSGMLMPELPHSVITPLTPAMSF